MNSVGGRYRSVWRTVFAKATRPAALVAGTVILLNLIRIVSSMVLTRMLNAEIFGIIGFLTSISIVLSLLSDLGFVTFVVRHKGALEKPFLDEIWTLRLIRSVGLSVALAAVAVPVSLYIGEPDLAPAIAVFGLSMLIEGFSSLASATAVRDGRIMRISLFDLVCAVIQTLLTIAIAYFLRSYWAIIYSTLIGNVIKAVLSYTMFPGSGRSWKFNRATAAELWQFSRFIMGSSALTMGITQSDKMVLSRYMSLDIFGLYILAATLAQAPTAFSSNYAGRVLYPNFANIVRENKEKLKDHYYRSRRNVNLAFNFCAGGLLAGAPLVIELLYDPRYRFSAFFLQILAINLIFIVNNQAANAAMIVLGRMRNSLMINVVRATWLGAGGLIGLLMMGPTGFVIAAGTYEGGAQLYNWWITRKAGLLRVSEEVLLLAAAAVGAGVGWAVSEIGLRFVH